MKIDIIGDIHGCFTEFEQLTKKLGYSWKSGIPVHPDHRKLGFVGDLTDRGPHSLKIIEIVYELTVVHKSGVYVPGNHCNKLYRYFLGNKVTISHGLETTAAEFTALPPVDQKAIRQKWLTLYEQAPLYQVLDEGKLVLAHAGIRKDYIGLHNEKVKTFVLYGDITGKKHPDGSPIRRNWAAHYNGDAWIVYGHTPVREPLQLNRTFNIDTGCVFGGKLTALRYPEFELISVPSSLPFVPEKFQKL